ncbi:hypothetical protein [Desulfofundulus sp. TPOSR]|uniref:hypothetical protein n=1 Tax=Desulfofundulus sp. TPOSR TaxID=2714340 RepID=UPI0037C07D57
MELLRISRSTLNRLRWENKIKVNKLPNGYYDYDEKSVYEYLLKTTGSLSRGKPCSTPGCPQISKRGI